MLCGTQLIVAVYPEYKSIVPPDYKAQKKIMFPLLSQGLKKGDSW